MIFPVILAGGKGERFWPYSNSRRPKQLLPLVTSKSMLEDILGHVRGLGKIGPIHLIVSRNLSKPIQELLGNEPAVRIVAEPQGKNTAAAIALASRLISRIDPMGVMLVLTADHAIAPAAEFRKAMRASVHLATRGESLVTFGIRPDRPEIGYGYIESAPGSQQVLGLEVRKVKSFHEKPDLKTARKYQKSGRFFWNSGMFAWRVDYLWNQFAEHLPQMHAALERLGPLAESVEKLEMQLKKVYAGLESVSIDVGILEKAPHIEMVIPQFVWDDMGSWTSLDRRLQPDAAGNRIAGGPFVGMETEGCSVFSSDGMIASFGVKNLLIVQHEGVTLVVEKSRLPELKELVKQVQGAPELKKFL